MRSRFVKRGAMIGAVLVLAACQGAGSTSESAPALWPSEFTPTNPPIVIEDSPAAPVMIGGSAAGESSIDAAAWLDSVEAAGPLGDPFLAIPLDSPLLQRLAIRRDALALQNEIRALERAQRDLERAQDALRRAALRNQGIVSPRFGRAIISQRIRTDQFQSLPPATRLDRSLRFDRRVLGGY